LAAEVLKLGTIAEHVVDRGQHGRGHGDNRLLRAAPVLEPGKLRVKVTVFGARRRPGRLDHRGLEPRGAGSRAGRAALSGTLVEAWYETGPREQVAGGRKGRDVV